MRNNVKYPRTDKTFGGWFGPYVITLGLCVPGKLRGLSLSLYDHDVTLLAGVGVQDLCNEVVQPRSLFVLHGSFVQLTWTASLQITVGHRSIVR